MANDGSDPGPHGIRLGSIAAELLLRRLAEFESNAGEDDGFAAGAAFDRAAAGRLEAMGGRLVFREAEGLMGPNCEPLLYEDGWGEWRLESELERTGPLARGLHASIQRASDGVRGMCWGVEPSGLLRVTLYTEEWEGGHPRDRYWGLLDGTCSSWTDLRIEREAVVWTGGDPLDNIEGPPSDGSLPIDWDAHNYLEFAVAAPDDPALEEKLERVRTEEGERWNAARTDAERTAAEDESVTHFVLDWGATAAEMAANCRRAADWLERVSTRWPGHRLRTDID